MARSNKDHEIVSDAMQSVSVEYLLADGVAEPFHGQIDQICEHFLHIKYMHEL